MEAVRGAAPRRAPTYEAEKERMNAWTVGLAGGLIEGAPLRFAAEMARVVDDGPNLHVLPIVTRGPTENLNSLLYLRGIDTAIINSDALDEYRNQMPQIRRQITYVLNLFPSELHIFVRPEI
ncbi:C4-dicarboxylate ABC transporter substrate-binding protein, partial [Bosea sp. 2RAB26]